MDNMTIAMNPCDQAYNQQINTDILNNVLSGLDESNLVSAAELMKLADSVNQARDYTPNGLIAQFAMFFIRSHRELIHLLIKNHAEIWKHCGHGDSIPESLLNRVREISYYLFKRCKLDLTLSECGLLAVVYGFHEPRPKEYLSEEDVIALVARYLGVVIKQHRNQANRSKTA